MATIGSAKATLVNKIDSLTSSATAKDTIFLAKALKENTTHHSFTFLGAWAASTAYALDDVVTTSGKTYICILAYTSGSSFAVGSNWSLMAEKGTDGTTVGVGTAGQVLKTNSAGTGTEWGTGSGINGGTKRTYTSGGKNYESRTFLGSGDITFPDNKVIDFFMIGGGGSGGMHDTTNGNGGGGAGGAVEGIGYTIPAGSYNIKVGVGARGAGIMSYGPGQKGEPSIFASFVGGGGGGGASTSHNPAETKSRTVGGCGGGARHDANSGGATNQDTYSGISTVTGYGYAGADHGTTWSGGGGGGIGGQGINGGGGTHDCEGGQGRSCTFKDGTTIYYGGGGGGGANSSERGGDAYHGAGRGWGTTFSYNYTDFAGMNNQVVNATTLGSSGMDAFDNTGSGGGAGSYWQGGYCGAGAGNGGSGIVIIRWEV